MKNKEGYLFLFNYCNKQLSHLLQKENIRINKLFTMLHKTFFDITYVQQLTSHLSH